MPDFNYTVKQREEAEAKAAAEAVEAARLAAEEAQRAARVGLVMGE